jgi:hypothetical protein
VALRRRGDVLVAVVDDLDRPARLRREQRDVRREHRRVLLLAPEAAARHRLRDHDAVGVAPEQRLHRLVHVVRALHRADDVAASVGPLRHHRLRLDVHLLLRRRRVDALDHLRRARERRVEFLVGRVALADQELLEHVVVAVQLLGHRERVVDREHRRPRRDAELHRLRRLGRQRAGRRGDQRDRLVAMHHAPAHRDQRRLIVLDQQDHVLARDVGRGDHRHARPVERRIQLDRLEHPVRDLRAHRRAEPGLGRVEIVEVPRAAGDLRDAVDARHRGADRWSDGGPIHRRI